MAKSDLDLALERDPLEFMKTHSVFPQDYTGHNPGIFNKPNSDSKGGAALDETLVVERRARQIAYTKLALVVDKQNNDVQANTYNLFFETGDTIGTAAPDNIACWFLPWASNHLTTFQLPPKIPRKPGVATGKTHLDPDLFFTAAISGCSVMVAGDPKSPIVTHGGTRAARSKLTDENAFLAGNSRLHWQNLFQRELSKRGLALPIHGVHKGDYINTAFTGTTPEAAKYEKFLKDDKVTSMRVDRVMPQGCVFGVRDAAGSWSFYLQKTVTFTFTRLRKKKSLLSTSYVPALVQSKKGLAPGEKATMIEDQKTASVTIEVVRFFPGNGTAAASALLPPSQVKAILESYL
jgi:hypothetical protein